MHLSLLVGSQILSVDTMPITPMLALQEAKGARNS